MNIQAMTSKLLSCLDQLEETYDYIRKDQRHFMFIVFPKVLDAQKAIINALLTIKTKG